MKLACQRTLIIGILASGLLANCQTLFSAQKTQQMSRSSDMDRALSANEAMLRRFEKERADLIRNKIEDKEPHLITNKLKVLDGKITFLERELKRVKQVKKTPWVLQWRPRAKPELRRRIYLAMIRKKVELSPSQKSSPRQKPVLLTLPEKVGWLPFAGSSDRKESSEQAVSEKGDKINSRLPKTGRDWKNMTQEEKEIYILSMMGNLSHRDIFLEKSYIFYIDAIDHNLQINPSLENEYVHKILIASAYEHEPESRQDIDNIGK